MSVSMVHSRAPNKKAAPLDLAEIQRVSPSRGVRCIYVQHFSTWCLRVVGSFEGKRERGIKKKKLERLACVDNCQSFKRKGRAEAVSSNNIVEPIFTHSVISVKSGIIF